MTLKVKKVDVWAVEFRDEAGGLAKCLAPIAAAGANLECIIARRQADKFQAGLAFLTPIKGKKVIAAAMAAGMAPAEELTTLRVEGLDTPGSGSRIMNAIADAGINMRGVSSMSAGKNFVAYIGLDSDADAETVTKILKKLGTGKGAAKRKLVRT
jgi:hypothetical protein